jgi:hypothetical protein
MNEEIDRCSAVLEEIKEFNEREQTSISITLEGLTPKEREQIYNAVETDYDGKLQYEKRIAFHGGDKQVTLIVTKVTGDTQTKMISVTVDDAVVRHFRRHTKLPLPLSKHQFIDYYLDCLDPYTDCRAMFSQFLQDIEAHEMFYKLNNRIEEIVNRIVSHMKEHPSTQIFKNGIYTEEMNFRKSSSYRNHCKLYTKQNHDKLFISVDIIKANYTIVKHYHPEIFDHLSTWEDFVLSFCNEKPIHTLKLSKPIRERIFGNANFGKKLDFLAEYFVYKILHEMNVPHDNLMMVATDEIVLSYDPVTFHRIFNRYHGTFYKVLAFRLVKLPKYDYFVKEYFDPSSEVDNQQIVFTHSEFKCIPLPFIMQCIKQYEGKPVLEIDRKFSVETGDVATFDESIF